MITVSFGTIELLTTFTSFAPARMMPACSACLPTMKPCTSCRNTIGTRDLVAVHHEAGRLVGRVGIDHAADLQFAAGGPAAMLLIGDDSNRMAADFRERRDERLAELGLVFLQRIVIDDARQHVAHIVLAAPVGGNEIVDAIGG